MKSNTFLECPTEAHPDNNDECLARLEMQRNDIINEWLHYVQNTPLHSSDKINLAQLKDHLPQLLDDLTECLNHHQGMQISESSTQDCADIDHGGEFPNNA